MSLLSLNLDHDHTFKGKFRIISLQEISLAVHFRRTLAIELGREAYPD